MLDTKGPEIRTGFLKEESNPVKLTAGQEITLTTDYDFKGDSSMLALSYKSLPKDVTPGSQILIADGSVVLEVLSCNVEEGTVKVSNGLGGSQCSGEVSSLVTEWIFLCVYI